MKEASVEYWVWLQSVLGAGTRTDEIIAYFESPEELYSAGEREWLLSGVLSPDKIEKLKRTSLSEAEHIVRECRIKGFKIVTPDNPLYPARLKKITDFPLALYVAGDPRVLNAQVSIGVVGARQAGEYGTKTAQRFAYQLSKAGAVIVSGGALGVDSEAHAGAMLADGKTIAYLGCGLSVNYLMENAPLRRAIARHGAVVSEYPPQYKVSKASFPQRNRLISGTSLGVVVIEAGERSGSLVTARLAGEQGREVFAVPGDVVRSSFTGANSLIRKGAKPVFTAADVLCEYEQEYGALLNMKNAGESLENVPYTDYRNYKKNKDTKELSREKTETAQKEREKEADKSFIKRELTEGVSENAKIVYSALEGEPVHIDDIVRKTSLKMNDVLSSLTELELFGYAEAMNGKKYKVK